MRRPLLLLAFLALGACGADPGGDPAGSAPGASALAADAIEVTTLAAQGTAALAVVAPAPLAEGGARADRPPPARPGNVPAAAAPSLAVPADQPAPVPRSDRQIACEKQGGSYVAVKSMFACVRVPRDAGKRCTSAAECSGECLARSGTCAPYDPLLGCNEVLDTLGRRVTLCLG